MGTQLSDSLRLDGWDVLIYLDWDVLERTFVGAAELYLDDSFKCRIGLSGDFETADAAAAFLREHTRRFIDDWRHRDHPADSDFSEL